MISMYYEILILTGLAFDNILNGSITLTKEKIKPGLWKHHQSHGKYKIEICPVIKVPTEVVASQVNLIPR